MFKTVAFAAALVASANAWGWEPAPKAEPKKSMDDRKSLDIQVEAYGVDNQNYGHQGRGGYGYGGYGYGGYGYGGYGGNASWKVADNHNSHRTAGHQGQGHNQWVDNAWNQWGTNNHWDNQKFVDNKWGNNSGKINVTLNSVSGHYDQAYGNQSRGMGYLGHQNVSGEIGYTVGLAGHSFGYQKGDHPVGYVNDKDYGYGGWANNLGAWNHGANYDNFGNQHHDDHTRGVANEGEDSYGIKENRRVGHGYGDIDELDDEVTRTRQYGNLRVGVDSRSIGHGRLGRLGALGGIDGYGYGGYGYGLNGGYGGYYGYDNLGYHGYGQRAYVAPSDDYSGNGGRSLGGSLLGRGARYGHGYGYGGYGYGRSYDNIGTREEEMEHSFKKPAPKHAW